MSKRDQEETKDDVPPTSRQLLDVHVLECHQCSSFYLIPQQAVNMCIVGRLYVEGVKRNEMKKPNE